LHYPFMKKISVNTIQSLKLLHMLVYILKKWILYSRDEKITKTTNYLFNPGH
jgi:hypothetical protein